MSVESRGNVYELGTRDEAIARVKDIEDFIRKGHKRQIATRTFFHIMYEVEHYRIRVQWTIHVNGEFTTIMAVS